tara:strand:- start:2521 stop:2745 length:225 start_codon:yes stop_codon:yes gene_type:complete
MKRPRTLKDLQNDPRVSEIYSEVDDIKTWWCYLKHGWQDSENKTCHTIHEDTIKRVCSSVHYAIPYPNDPELNN